MLLVYNLTMAAASPYGGIEGVGVRKYYSPADYAGVSELSLYGNQTRNHSTLARSQGTMTLVM